MSAGSSTGEPRRPATAPASDLGRETRALEGRFLRLPPERTSPRRARASLDWLDGYLSRERLDDARLLVSELVSNSVEHARLTQDEDWIRLEVVVLPAMVRVEVWDSSPGFKPARPRLPEPGARRGRGLYLVELLSDRWGFGPSGISRVWFDLDR